MNTKFVKSSIITMAGIGFGVIAVAVMNSSRKEFKRAHTLKPLSHKEDKFIENLIATSRTQDILITRYVNWLVNKNGADSLADGYYLYVINDLCIVTIEELYSEFEKYFLLHRYHDKIGEKFGTEYITPIYSRIISELYNRAVEFEDKYRCFDTIEQSVIWERVIPVLETRMSMDRMNDDYSSYATHLHVYASLLLKYNYNCYKEFHDTMAELLTSTDVDSLPKKDQDLYEFLKDNIDNVNGIFKNIEISYADEQRL